jgi:3'-5' exoribonuclease 1
MHYIIVDLESTCWENDRSRQNEIIEIGAVKLDENLNIVSEFQTFVKPKLHPVLSDFCKKLTSIRQEDVDQAPSFKEALKAFHEWMGEDYWLCSWGFYDKKQLKMDCELHKLPTGWLRNHISIKHQHGKMVVEELRAAGKPQSQIKRFERGVGMETALKMLNIPLEGTHHRGIDDARNIAKIFVKIFEQLKFPEIV